jgi:subtilase family serine protease
MDIKATHTRHVIQSHKPKLRAGPEPSFFPSNQRTWFYPSELASIYGFPSVNNNKVVIGVLSFGGGLFGDVDLQGVLTNGDVQRLWQEQGMAQEDMPLVVISPLFPGQNNIDNPETGENTLDAAVIGGCYPSRDLTIILYVLNGIAGIAQLSDYGGVGMSVFDRSSVTVDNITYTPKVYSMSWSLSSLRELANPQTIGSGNPDMLGAEAKFASLAGSGINIFVSSGDRGATNGVPGTAAYVTWPSCSPSVIAVGGTNLVCPSMIYNNPSTVETGWSGSGGGQVFLLSRPIRLVLCRSTPDLAMISTPGMGTYIGGTLYVLTGTSLSAPLLATFVAVINPGVFINTLIYRANPSCFNDITVGNNGFSARAGYDYCTGLGSINGSIFRQALYIVTSVAVTPSTCTLYVGDVSQLTATTTPPQFQVSWSSSNINVCTVDSNGGLRAVAQGTCLITATSGNVSGSCLCTVAVILPAAVALDRTAFNLLLNSSFRLTPTVLPNNATNKIITWNSSNSNATVNAGLVTGRSVGLCTISATTSNNLVATCEVDIYVVRVTGIALNNTGTSSRLLLHNTLQLYTTVAPPNASNASVLWSSNVSINMI